MSADGAEPQEKTPKKEKKEKKPKGGAANKADKAAKINPAAEALALVKLLLFVPVYAPLWIYRRFERDGKLVLLSGLCALAVGGALAGLILGAGQGTTADASGALGMVGIGVILIGAHFSA